MFSSVQALTGCMLISHPCLSTGPLYRSKPYFASTSSLRWALWKREAADCSSLEDAETEKREERAIVAAVANVRPT